MARQLLGMGKGKIIGCSLGSCVHVAGVANFLALARECGWDTVFLGPAQSPAQVLQAVKEHDPDMVALSYRLTPETGREVIAELKRLIEAAGETGRRYAFGGTSPVCQVARQSGLFEAVFNGSDGPEAVLKWLGGSEALRAQEPSADTLLGRIQAKAPYPLLRHHFGRPSVEETVEGARLIAEAGVLDVLSLGPDQNAQESFFRPQEMAPGEDGAGGVPVRTAEDLRRIYQATRCGNRPLLRCYSGTRDLLPWARMSVETIRQAWGAIPLCWYNVLDGRSDRVPAQSIAENQEAMCWYAQRGLPVEVNEAHQWSLRGAHDALAVATAYLAACNAKQMGVQTYVAQYMVNTPPQTSPAMDLGKMLAKRELIESLCDDGFSVLCQVRAGLTHFRPEPDLAKGQLAAATALGLALEPQIVHVVGYSEADHAATAEEVIESCGIAHGVLADLLEGLPDLTADPQVQQRRRELVAEARVILRALPQYARAGVADPPADAETLAACIRVGLLDAPHLQPSAHCRGQLRTRMVKGACLAWDEATSRPLGEAERIARLPGAA